MPPFTAKVLFEIVAVIGTVGSLFFYLLSVLGIASFLRARKRLGSVTPNEQLPWVSILKPLKGTDPEMWESFCSHCEQDYPSFEIIFGVSDPADPAVEIVRELQAKYPSAAMQLMVCDRVFGTNVKVSNLVQMLPAAHHEILLINDSDIRVPPDYLRNVIAPLNDESVGLVTCLYRGASTATLGSRLEGLGISTDFVPGVLSARYLEGGLHFGLGSTLAFRRSDLAAIGGFETMVDYLADDYELGHRISSLGKKIELSDVTVTTFLPAYTLTEFIRHQLRWWRTIRDARRRGYAGLLFTFGVPWVLLGVVAARGATWAWGLFWLVLIARCAVGMLSATLVLDDQHSVRDLVLLPLRDFIAPFVWLAAFAGNRIEWRGDAFILKNGRLTKA